MPSLTGFRSALIVLIALLNIECELTRAADWPTFRGNNSRTAFSSEQVTFPLNVAWKYESPALPKMAWSDGTGRVIEEKLLGNRVKFDDVFHPTVVGGKLFFGATDHQLHCMDLKTGATEWTYFTGAPIRLAPSVVNGRVYFGSDDGHVYCVNAATGKSHWQFRAGPEEDWLIARGELVSRWPVRTGVLIDKGVAFFGAGVFPHEDVYLYAVNADDGSVIWKQDSLSDEDAGRNDLSPQGYLLASDDLLFVPSGRSLPAAFDRKTGKLVHKRTHGWRSAAGGVVGGTNALLADAQIYSGGEHHLLAMDQQKGDVGFGWFAGHQMAVAGDAAYVATGTVVARLDRQEYAVNSRVRHQLEMEIYDLSGKLRSEKNKETAGGYRQKIADASLEIKRIADIGVTWQKETADDAALLATPDVVFLGGQNQVTAYSALSGESVWQAAVEGLVSGLAVADGNLVVSTDTGRIYVFANGEPTSVPNQSIAAFPSSEFYQQAAKEILAQTGVKRGFCLVIDGEEGQLAYELSRQSELKIYVVESDPEKVATARANLTKAGIYGSRVTVHEFDVADIPYSNYFANLIVSDRFVKTGETLTDPALVVRHLKPCGGVMCLGQPQTSDTAGAADFVAKAGESNDLTATESIQKSVDGWAMLSRGMLRTGRRDGCHTSSPSTAGDS